MDTNIHHCHRRRSSLPGALGNIEEDAETRGPPGPLRPPETPTETMEFLARSWSLSAVEISKALTMVDSSKPAPDKYISSETTPNETIPNPNLQLMVTTEANGVSPPISPRLIVDVKGAAKGKSTVGGWLKDYKERRKAEDRCRNAQLYAATSVAGVAAAVAALVASTLFTSEAEGSSSKGRDQKTAAAVASAAALIASHCMETAQTIGAPQDKILSAIRSAVQAQSSGDVMALTAGAATALRGAATLRARLHREIQVAAAQAGERELTAMAFVCRGGELLKRTRKGALHWKQVSVYITSNWQVIIKTRSTHMVGTFVKQKKGIILDVCSDIPTWPRRLVEDRNEQKAYFGIRTPERLIEFECRSKCAKKMWIEGIKQMLDCHANMTLTKAVREAKFA